jgi:hypothetical protein
VIADVIRCHTARDFFYAVAVGVVCMLMRSSVK